MATKLPKRRESPSDASGARPGPKKIDWRPAFLSALRATGKVSQAARAAGINRKFAYVERSNNPEFAERWEEAEQQLIEDLEHVAYKRAMDGSDRLVEFILKARLPERYSDRQRIEHSGLRDPALVVSDWADNLSEEQLNKEIEALQRGIQAQLPPPKEDE